MSIKNYNTKRNQQLDFWDRPAYLPSIKFDKIEMLKKVHELHMKQPKAGIWPSLASQLQLGKKLTYRQQCLIETSYYQLKKGA